MGEGRVFHAIWDKLGEEGDTNTEPHLATQKSTNHGCGVSVEGYVPAKEDALSIVQE